ncbi:MAG: ABC transporter substrate-binding protein [Chloroflexota bacterium]
MKRLMALVLAAVLMISVFTVSGCGKPKVTLMPGQVEGYLHEWFAEEDPGTFDFQADTTLAVYSLARALFSTLVRYKTGTLELEPELLAEMPTVDETKTVYTFKLRDGVKFHDGTVLKSSDVKYTFERMLDADGVGASSWLFEPIKGAADMMDPEKKVKTLAGFEIISDTEFKVTLDKPYAPFLQNLAVPSASILPEAACKAAGDKWSLQPIGTGPFVLKEYKPKEIIVLANNPNYFEGPVSLPGIDYVVVPDTATGLMQFEKMAIDVAGVAGQDRIRIEGLKDKKGEPMFNVVESIPLNTYYLILNMNEPVFKNANIRKAIAMGINKQALIDNVFEGEAALAKAFVTPGIPGAYAKGTGPALDYNPEEAKKLVAESGVKNPKITLWQRGGTAVAEANVAIQAMMKEIGIECEVQIVDRPVFAEARGTGKVPANYGNWWADIPDPDNYLYTYFSPTNTMSSNYKNKTVQDMLAAGRVETDPAKRAAIYQEAERIIIAEDFAIIPILHSTEYYAVQKSITGFTPSATGVIDYRNTSKAKGAK